MTEIQPWDAAEGLNTPEKQAAFLRVTMEDGDAGEIAQALGIIARARGMSALAKSAGIPRDTLYKSLREDGNPGLAIILKVLAALDMKLSVRAKDVEETPKPGRKRREPSQSKAA